MLSWCGCPMADQDPSPRSDVTAIIQEIQEGNQDRSSELLPLIYDELRNLARAKLARERPGQTLEATALVHEAYLRLVSDKMPAEWNGRGHFFGAAAEAMRRILIENSRRRKAERHGGKHHRIELNSGVASGPDRDDRLLELNDAIDELESSNPASAELAKLILFTGLSVEESAKVIGISSATAYRKWKYARACLRVALD